MPRFVGDLEYVQNKNRNSRNPKVRESANLMFSRIRNELGELSEGLDIDYVTENQYKYTFSDGFATIYITMQKDITGQEYLFIDEIKWNYKAIDWWNIIEREQKLDQIITETLNRVIRESILKENLKKKNPCH